MNDASFSILVPRSRGGSGSCSGSLRHVLNRLKVSASTGYQRYRQRRALAQLDEHLLRDIGVTQAQAGQESGKPFWRA